VTRDVGNGLHPWITVWLNPRATIRGVVDSGRRGDPALISAVWGLSAGIIFAAEPSKTFPPGMKPLIVALSVIVGTLLMTGVNYMGGALMAWSGRKVGGKATVGEISEALALSMIPFVSFFVVGAVAAISIRLMYGGQVVGDGHQPVPVWTYSLVGLGAVLGVWSWVLRRNCILEVQGFSAAQGRRASWIAMRRYLLLLALAVLSVAPVAVSRIFQMFRR
jgi:hypothetical protein